MLFPLKTLGFADAPGFKDEEGNAPLVSTKNTLQPDPAGKGGKATQEAHRPLARQLNSQSGSRVMQKPILEYFAISTFS